MLLFLVGAFIVLAQAPVHAQKPVAHPQPLSAKQRRANARLLAMWDTYPNWTGPDDVQVATRQEVQSVLNQGADVNARDKDGNTALMEAAANGDVANVQMLLARGANIDAQDNQGRTALCWAITGPKIDMGLRFGLVAIRTPQEAARLHKAYIAHRIAIIQLLLDKGANVNTQDHLGNTPLIIAANIPIDASYHDIVLPSDQHRMATNSNISLIKLLLTHQGEVNTADRAGKTALMAATATGKEEEVNLLLSHGANVNAKDKQGQSVLMWSALWNQPEIAQSLLDKGVPVDVSDNHGNTPLMMAAACPHAYEVLPDNVFRDQITLIKILLRHGANSAAMNDKGDTALLLAQRHKMADAATVLQANGVTRYLKSMGIIAAALLLLIIGGVRQYRRRQKPRL